MPSRVSDEAKQTTMLFDALRESNASEVGGITVPIKGCSDTTRASYDLKTLDLSITFMNGASCRYASVPFSIFTSLVAAESPGRYWNENIKGGYRNRSGGMAAIISVAHAIVNLLRSNFRGGTKPNQEN
jgi:hypothetical protein